MEIFKNLPFDVQKKIYDIREEEDAIEHTKYLHGEVMNELHDTIEEMGHYFGLFDHDDDDGEYEEIWNIGDSILLYLQDCPNLFND